MALNGWLGRVLVTSLLGLAGLGGCGPEVPDRAARRVNEDAGPMTPPDPSTPGPTTPSGATGSGTDGTRR